jgi:hypothetical protein
MSAAKQQIIGRRGWLAEGGKSYRQAQDTLHQASHL